MIGASSAISPQLVIGPPAGGTAVGGVEGCGVGMSGDFFDLSSLLIDRNLLVLRGFVTGFASEDMALEVVVPLELGPGSTTDLEADRSRLACF